MDTNRVAKIFLLRGDQILLLKSSKLNKWHLPGGHIQQGETYEQGLKREVQEETGCELKYYHRIRSIRPNVYLYIGALKTHTIKLSDEHNKHMWISWRNALNCDVCRFTHRDIRYLQTIFNAVKRHAHNNTDLETETDENLN